MRQKQNDNDAVESFAMAPIPHTQSIDYAADIDRLRAMAGRPIVGKQCGNLDALSGRKCAANHHNETGKSERNI